MLKIIAAGKRNPFVSIPIFVHTHAVGNVLFFLLFSGILLGCVFSIYSPFDLIGWNSFFSVTLPAESSFLSAFLFIGKFCFLVVLSATSYLGVIVIPALVLIRGCALGCAIASFYVTQGYYGLLIALVQCGVTELLTIPLMMLLAEYLFFYSKALLHLRLGKRVIRDHLQPSQRILILIFILLSLAIIYQCAIRPLIHI